MQPINAPIPIATQSVLGLCKFIFDKESVPSLSISITFLRSILVGGVCVGSTFLLAVEEYSVVFCMEEYPVVCVILNSPVGRHLGCGRFGVIVSNTAVYIRVYKSL